MSDLRYTIVRLPCPDCGRIMRGVEVGQTATTVTRRTCRSCGVLWQAVLTPLGIRQGYGRFDDVKFARLGPAGKRKA